MEPVSQRPKDGGERPAEPGFDPLGRQIGVAARSTRALLDSVLADAGTTFSSWTVLAALNARGPVIQKDLAQMLDMIGPSVVERIDQLEQADLVTRSTLPQDRRASLVGLTDAGRALFGRLHEIMRATETALTEGLDPADVETARRVLAHVTQRARALRIEGGRRCA